MNKKLECIPGNGHPDAVSPQQAQMKKRRRGLLAMIHIAKTQMGLNEGEYEMILKSYKVESAAALTMPQLENLVKYLKHLGWKPLRKEKDPQESGKLDALRRRCVSVAKIIPNGENRLAGLAKSICGVSSLTWCREAGKLEKLLAVLEHIKRKEAVNQDVSGA